MNENSHKLFYGGGGYFAKALVFHTYLQSPFQLLSTQEWGWPNTANKIGPLSSLNNHVSHSMIVICNLPTSHPSFWKWTGPQTRGRRLWRGATWRQTWPPVSSGTPAENQQCDNRDKHLFVTQAFNWHLEGRMWRQRYCLETWSFTACPDQIINMMR